MLRKALTLGREGDAERILVQAAASVDERYGTNMILRGRIIAGPHPFPASQAFDRYPGKAAGGRCPVLFRLFPAKTQINK